MKVIASVLIFLCLMSVASASDYIIDGDTVYIDNSNVYLSAYPHTLSESGYVYFNLTSKHFSGDTDFCFGYDSNHCKPISAEIFIGGSWVDISDRFNFVNYNYDNMTKWYYLKEIPILSNTNYTIRSYLEIRDFSIGGKYGIAIKPSLETISQAINNNHFYYLDPWFDGNYAKRKVLNLTGGTSGAQTNYQLLINVTYDTDMQADFDDIRFSNDTHQIDTWLESKVDSSYALIWVEFPTTPANGVIQTYYMYYGNNSVASAWSGANTFIDFSDFDDLTGWTQQAGTWTVSGGILSSATSAEGFLRRDTPITETSYIIETKGRTTNNLRYTLFAEANNIASNTVSLTLSVHPNTNYLACRADWSWSPSSMAFNNNTWYIGHLRVDSGNNICKAYNKSRSLLGTTAVQTNDGSGTSNYWGFYENTDAYDIDWTIVRKYAANPSTYILGAEEEQPFYISINHYEQSPTTLFTNYTGLLTSSFIVNSSHPLNFSSLAYLYGMNYTLAADYHNYLKVPANTIANHTYNVYRAHNRNTTPLMWWETNNTITEGNVWKWSGGVYEDHWIASNVINATHTYINVTGEASNVYPSTFYLGRKAMYVAPKTPVEINKGQGIIFKVWDVEQFRGRNNDYFVNLYFDTQIETTPDSSIDIWYCNGSFDPNTDDPTTCEFCARMDTWTSDRWMDHVAWQPDNNVSYSKALVASASDPPEIPPDTINYVYLASNTVSSKSYILNATNTDPGICNLTFAQTNSMWLRDEVAGTNTPYAYTPSFYITFVRDYLEFTHHMYISNTNGDTIHSDYLTVPIGISNYKPTHCRYNYFWWNTSTDYNMTGTYTKDFYANITLGFDPDNGAVLNHVLSLYNENNVFVATINSSINGSNNDTDIFIDTSDYRTGGIQYYLHILSTDNEGTTSVSKSSLFSIEQERVPTFAGVQTLLEGIPNAFRDTIDDFFTMLPFLISLAMFGFLGFIIIFITGSLKKW